ncbi:MAG: ATP-dependent helicase [Candidatus Gygaella obscura]|nr:ATP-dependent helicase [Candidatus Gygaella obscura]
MQKIDYKNQLNEKQFEAVTSSDGAYLVIAGAGSGKTRTLVYRVAYLVEKGVAPERILLLTFTRRAAEQMLRRASGLLDNRCQHVSGGTFHSFANFVLRKYAKLLGLANNYTILDESDAEDVINLLRTQLELNKQDKRFPRKKAILDMISKSINKVEPLKKVIYDEYPQFLEWEDQISKIKQLYKKYKFEKSLLDYDDLLVFLKKLLIDFEDVRASLSNKYKYIMVDEYQDTNKLQALIVSLLASIHKNIMVVGDDSQSIYSFRGANFKNIMDFPKIFPDTKVISLEENYRSTQTILNLTNNIISMAEERFKKFLYTKKEGGALPIYVDAADESAQSKYIVDKILEFREQNIELSDMAVLFRSGWHSNDLEVELASRNIPFIKYGGRKFVEAAHIKDILSYLRIVHNVKDEVSWHRLLLLCKGIGPKSAVKIINEVVKKDNYSNIAVKLLEKIDIAKLFELLTDIKDKGYSLLELLDLFLKYYQPLFRQRYDDFNKRVNDLDSLRRIAARYESLEKFLADMALEPPERSIVERALKNNDDSTLTLSTIHSAKGLEWHTVFIIYVAEGYLPSYLSLDNDDAIEEERRLLYVASTRAKENLFLIKPQIDRSPQSFFMEGKTVFTQISRFIDTPKIFKDLLDCEPGVDSKEEDKEFAYELDSNQTKNDDFFDNIKEYFKDDFI